MCSDDSHPINDYLNEWVLRNQKDHEISTVRAKEDLPGGDILFLISCSEIISAEDRATYKSSLVIHASDLPHGRGWSPHIWQLLEGADKITVSLLEAEDQVDSGRIWHQVQFDVPSHALWDEINADLFAAEIELLNFAVNHFSTINPQAQNSHIEPTFYRRRYPEDSRIDAQQSIASQFNQIRVCDPIRFPAYFEMHGCRYKITLEKSNA